MPHSIASSLSLHCLLRAAVQILILNIIREYLNEIKSVSANSCLKHAKILNSFPASGNFCRLLITFANSLNPEQARHVVGPDLGPNYLTL